MYVTSYLMLMMYVWKKMFDPGCGEFTQGSVKLSVSFDYQWLIWLQTHFQLLEQRASQCTWWVDMLIKSLYCCQCPQVNWHPFSTFWGTPGRLPVVWQHQCNADNSWRSACGAERPSALAPALWTQPLKGPPPSSKVTSCHHNWWHWPYCNSIQYTSI